MASNADVDYESDPDDSPLPTMRRREAASDDEDGSDGGEVKVKKSTAGIPRSDDESNDQGAAEAYEDELDDYDDEDLEQQEEEYDELGEELETEESKSKQLIESKEGDENNNKEGEKKENEPYAVPTTGAFYMHDDRFQENARGGGGRRRRITGGGRRIWNSKEEGAWVHDRFEELNIRHHDDGRRRGRGGYRGRGRGGRGTRPNYNNENQNNHNNNASRSVRGRGTRRYEPVNRPNNNNNNPSSRNGPSVYQDKQIMQRNQETNMKHQHGSSSSRGQSLSPKPQNPSTQNPNKNLISSSLNYASPPFYPSETKPTLSPPNVNNNNSRGPIVKISSPPLSENNKPKGNQNQNQTGFVYGSGSVNVPHGEQGFAGTPALLPVMQFSGQRPGVPALGMAVPGYVANSELGFGNSAWVLGPGALGASYPYVAGYYNDNSRPNSQASSSAPSRETGVVKSPDGIRSSQKTEEPTEESGQRQNKPRRYSEMNFGQ